MLITYTDIIRHTKGRQPKPMIFKFDRSKPASSILEFNQIKKGNKLHNS